MPGIDHHDDRNSDRCSVLVAREWLRGACREQAWRNILGLIENDPNVTATSPILILSDANLVTRDLIQFLQNHSINAQGFESSSESEDGGDAPRNRPGQTTMDFLEWWLLSRSRKILFAGQPNMDKRPSSFSIAAANMADAPYDPITHRGCVIIEKPPPPISPFLYFTSQLSNRSAICGALEGNGRRRTTTAATRVVHQHQRYRGRR
jgi:hypothetical protein